MIRLGFAREGEEDGLVVETDPRFSCAFDARMLQGMENPQTRKGSPRGHAPARTSTRKALGEEGLTVRSSLT